MGKITYFFQVKKSCHPFDGMKGSEDGVNTVCALGILLQIKNINLYFIDIFQSFCNKISRQRDIRDLSFFLNRRVLFLSDLDRLRLSRDRHTGDGSNCFQKGLNITIVFNALLAIMDNFLHQGDTLFKEAESLLFVFQGIEYDFFQDKIQTRGHMGQLGNLECPGCLDDLLKTVHEFS